MEAFHPLKHFTGRDDIIEAFRELVREDSPRWVMMVDGLSGTGKSLLIEWLTDHELEKIPHAYLKLSQGFHELDGIDALVEQLGRKIAASYRKKRAALEARDGGEVFNLHYQKNSRMSASGGRIQDASQVDNLHIDMGEYGDVVRLERLGRRLDILTDVLDPLKDRVWVLFLDETEHMQNPHLHQFFLEYLAPRLRETCAQFRLYMTGQQVPKDVFPAHETRLASLKAFSDREIEEICHAVGIDDAPSRRAIIKLTGGHPLLVGMCLERGGWQRTEAEKAEKLAREGGEAERSSWIYNRIIARFQHQETRDIAANLSLFEWFDLSFLRDVFEREIDKRVFDELVGRSFVKKVGPGRWQCHDILRSHLAAQTRQLEPIKTNRLYKKAFQHYRERVEIEEERLGERFFHGRAEYVTGAMHAVLQFSAKQSEKYCLGEMAPAVAMSQDAYLFSISRFLDSRELPAPIRELNHALKRFQEMSNSRRLTAELAAFYDRMASVLVEEGARGLAADLMRVSAIIYRHIGLKEKAVALARQAFQLEDNLESRIHLIRTLAKGDCFEEAQELHDQTRAQLGDSPELRLASVEIELAGDDPDGAMAVLTDAILAFPKQSDPLRLQAAELLYAKGDFEGAREHVDAVLNRDPDNRRARLIQIDLLVETGQVEAIPAYLKNIQLSVAELGIDHIFQLAQNPSLLYAKVEEILAEPSRAELMSLLIFMDSLSVKGEVDLVKQLLEIAVKKWPETRAVCQGKLMLAYIRVEDYKTAAEMGEALVDSPFSPMDIHISLSIAHEKLGNLVRAREVLQNARAFSFMRDIVDARIAHLLVQEGKEEEAFAFLRRLKAEGSLGNQAMSVLADLYLRKKQIKEALALYEKLIYLTGSDEQIPQQTIQVRGKYGILMVGLGQEEKALLVARNLTRDFPDWDEAYVVATRLFLMLRRQDEIVSLYRAIPDEKGVRKAQVISLLAEANTMGDFDPQVLLDALRNDPRRLDLVMALDIYYTARGRVDQALPLLREAEKISPGILKEVEALQASAVQGADPSKLQRLKGMVAQKPDSVLLKLALLRSLIDNGKADEALEHYAQYSQEHPAEITPYAMSSYLVSSKHFDHAAPFLEQVLAGEEIPELFVGLISQYLEHAGEPARRIQFYEKVAGQYAELKVNFLEMAADLHLDMKHPDRALEVLGRLEPEQQTPGTLLSKALAEKDLGQMEDAQITLESARAHAELKDPLRARILGELGEILKGRGDSEAAEAHFREGLTANPKRYQLYHQLAGILEDRGQWKDAYDTLRKLVEVEPGQLAKAEEKLARYREKMADGDGDRREPPTEAR